MRLNPTPRLSPSNVPFAATSMTVLLLLLAFMAGGSASPVAGKSVNEHGPNAAQAVPAPNFGIIEIQIVVDGRYEGKRVGAWRSRLRRNGTIEWSVRAELYHAGADAFVLIRIDDETGSFPVDIIPLDEGVDFTIIENVADASANVPPLLLKRVDDRLFVSVPPLTRILLPGDTFTSEHWPGITVTFHPLIHESDVLLFRVFPE